MKLRLWVLATLMAVLALSATADWVITDELIARVEARYGAHAVRQIRALQDVLDSVRTGSDLSRLKAVNNFFNAYSFRSDREQWSQDDYWETPFELMAVGAGDCEDFAVAKYFALRSLGLDDDKLRLMYVRARTGTLNQAHMVLTYYPIPDAEPLVLDNLVNDILPASARQDLEPVYSFNGQGLWRAKVRGLGQSIRQDSSLPQWQQLLERIEKGE